jgi:hypothetical protein
MVGFQGILFMSTADLTNFTLRGSYPRCSPAYSWRTDTELVFEPLLAKMVFTDAAFQLERLQPRVVNSPEIVGK